MLLSDLHLLCNKSYLGCILCTASLHQHNVLYWLSITERVCYPAMDMLCWQMLFKMLQPGHPAVAAALAVPPAVVLAIWHKADVGSCA